MGAPVLPSDIQAHPAKVVKVRSMGGSGNLCLPARNAPAHVYETWLEGDVLVVDTGALRLRYRPDGPFAPRTCRSPSN